MEAMPPEPFDAPMIPDGQDGTKALARPGMAREFARCQFRRCKTILTMGSGAVGDLRHGDRAAPALGVEDRLGDCVSARRGERG